MDIKDIIDITGGKLLNNYDLNKKINRIKIDSRTLEKNDVFICLKGENTDGNIFIKDAIRKKVRVILTENDLTDLKNNVAFIKVCSTYDALESIAKYIRNKYNVKTIAITGSTGKTTTKELISKMLATKYNVLKSEGNHNNNIGLPLTILKLNKGVNILVIELGMNHLNEINKLSHICKPDISVITNIGTSHIGNLGSIKNTFKAKMEIINGMDKGSLLVNGDNKYLKKIRKLNNIDVIKCGINRNNNFNCTNLKEYLDRTEFDLVIKNETHHFTFNVPGKHLISNVLIAIKISLLLNVSIEAIKEILKNFTMNESRLNITNKKNIKLIDDTYNSSYESLKGSVDLIKKDSNHKLLIIGDVLELGKYSKKIHKKIGKLLNIKDTDVLICGEEISILKHKYPHFNNNQELMNYIDDFDLIKPNTTILVEASHMMNFKEIVNFISKKIDTL